MRRFRRNGDFPVPQTRQAILTRLGETSHRGDQQAPAEEIKTAVVLAASPIPLFSPLGLEFTIVLAHKGEIEIPAALPCMLRARKNMKGGWLRGEI